jgi:hypothetical protein
MARTRYELRVYEVEHLKSFTQKLLIKLFHHVTRKTQHATSHTTRSKNQVVDFRSAIVIRLTLFSLLFWQDIF